MKKYMRISKFQNSKYEIAIHLKVIFTNILKKGNEVGFPKMRNSHFLGHHFCNGKVKKSLPNETDLPASRTILCRFASVHLPSGTKIDYKSPTNRDLWDWGAPETIGQSLGML